jgi:hypothetical protein
MEIKCFLLIPTGTFTERETTHGSCKIPLYKRSDNDEIVELDTAPIGAIWENTWYYPTENYSGFTDCIGTDGKSFSVRTPGGDWCIDSRASNCTKPEDHTHKCWVRHGVAPEFTVDKAGNTCSAGAGSILQGNYHGFLINGYLTNC